MSSSCASVIILKESLTKGPWKTDSPFIFAAYHNDKMPRGNDRLGPDASLEGRNLGADFANKDGWNMYHGLKVSGFPVHPHRGFETLTYVRQGYIDHADSLGNGGRFGPNDGQWMTAGSGVCHSEMMPCLNKDKENPVELWQIWINLPAAKKLVPPAYKMLWGHDLPQINAQGGIEIKLICGKLLGYEDKVPPSPPPNSYGSDPKSNMLIMHLEFHQAGTWTLPAAIIHDENAARGKEEAAAQNISLHRNLYFFHGNDIQVANEPCSHSCRIKLRPDLPCSIKTNGPASFLLLQGTDLQEPLVQHGPFVGNSRDDIFKAFEEYRRTGFGEWPWPHDDIVHPAQAPRFATYPDGSREEFPL